VLYREAETGKRLMSGEQAISVVADVWRSRSCPPASVKPCFSVGASGFSYEEAAICESAVGTIKSRVNRARTRLSKLLSIDSADRFGQDHTTRAVLTAGAGTVD